MSAGAEGQFDEGGMTGRQWLVVVLCSLLNAFDGYDVLSISFAAPGIAHEWSVTPALLGVVLSVELFGMAAGAVLLGQVADRLGRRPVLLGAVATVAVGMGCAWVATSVVQLGAFRLVTGMGLGGILAVTPSVAAELSQLRYRNLAVSFVAGGYPVGAFAGGAVAAHLVAFGWHELFLFGAVATGCLLPLVWWCVPETPAYLLARRPAHTMQRINATRSYLGLLPLTTLPAPHMGQTSRSGIRALFAPGLAPITALLLCAYLAHVSTVYYVLKWAPKIVADLGFSPAVAGGVLVWSNLGGTIGSLAFSLLTRVIKPVRAMLATMLLSSIGVATFGLVEAKVPLLSAAAFVAGFGMSATIVLFYAVLAEAFPANVRASGIGFVVGIGRAGSALSPIAAGMLFSNGFDRAVVSMLMACGSLVAVACIIPVSARLGAALTSAAAQQ